jgi:hypothetical protein
MLLWRGLFPSLVHYRFNPHSLPYAVLYLSKLLLLSGYFLRRKTTNYHGDLNRVSPFFFILMPALLGHFFHNGIYFPHGKMSQFHTSLTPHSSRIRKIFFINSPGGWVIPRIAIYDTMQFVRPDIQTICMGFAASMGSFLLVGGAITKRIAFPHAGRQ